MEVRMEAFDYLQIDDSGLDQLDRLYLKTLRECGKASLGVLSSKISVPALTIQRIIEPHLLKEGFFIKDNSIKDHASPRYMRALDFHDGEEKKQALQSLLDL